MSGAHTNAMAADAGLDRCPIMPTYGPPPVMMVRGEGSRVWDRDGKEYLDFLCGLAVTSLGHSHPAVTAAVAEQANTLLHVSNLFGTEPQVEVAQTLDRLNGGGGQVFFANSGAEANECALKLARKWGGGEHGRYQVISAFNSFHGRTMATLHATGQPAKHEPFQPLPPGFKHVALNDLDAVAAAVDPTVAAILLEPVQGEGGVNPTDHGYLRAVRELCDERDLLLIMDEVQTGLGRTGSWFGYQASGVQADIVTMAKALGNGVPIGACWARADVAAAFQPGDHGSTYGGQPLAAAAARAVLRTMEEMDAPRVATERGAELTAALLALDGVTSVRGSGMLVAAEIAPETLAGRTGADIAAACLSAGLIVNGISPTAIRMAPPLTIDAADMAAGVAIFDSVLRATAGAS